MNNLVYLSGPITSSQSVDWREEFETIVDKAIHCLSPKRVRYFQESSRLTGSQEVLNAGSSILKRSYSDVQNCSLIVANLLNAKEKSIGTMFELAWAYSQHKPIILIIEPGVENIHSHSELFAMCTYRVDNLQSAAELVDAFFNI